MLCEALFDLPTFRSLQKRWLVISECLGLTKRSTYEVIITIISFYHDFPSSCLSQRNNDLFFTALSVFLKVTGSKKVELKKKVKTKTRSLVNRSMYALRQLLQSSPYSQINILFLTTYIGEGNNSDGKESLKRQRSPKITTDTQEMSKFYKSCV